MKNFFGTFVICLILCGVITFFFAGLLLSNIWYITVVVALFLSILILAFTNLDFKIEQLEKKIEQMSENENNNNNG